jgi:hypothetical protein
MRGCAERAPESRGRGVEVRVGEMLRKPRQKSDAVHLAAIFVSETRLPSTSTTRREKYGTAGIEVA